MNSTKNFEHEKAKCYYKVYQANVFTKQRYRPLEVRPVTHSTKTCKQDSFCCCRDKEMQSTRNNADFKVHHPLYSEGRGYKKSFASEPEEPENFIERVSCEDIFRKYEQKRQPSSKREKHAVLTPPRCCVKRSCKKSTSTCSGISTISSNSEDSKLKEKREKREKKRKEKEQKRLEKESKRDLKRHEKKKRRHKKSKCKCFAKLQKLNTKCCSTSLDVIYNPRLLKCQGTTTMPKVPQRSTKVKTSPKVQLRPQKKYRDQKQKNTSDQKQKNTSDKVRCCTCNKPVIQDQLPLAEEPDTARVEDPDTVGVEKPILEKEEQPIADQFENKEEYKTVDYPGQGTDLERQEENQSEENAKLSKLNDICCSTSTDLIYNPRSLAYQGSTSNPRNLKRVANVKPEPRLQSRSSKMYGDRQLKNTSDKVRCCTCKRPIIQSQLALAQNLGVSRVEELVQKMKEQPIDHQIKGIIFENKEAHKTVDHPIQSTHFKKQLSKKHRTSKLKNTRGKVNGCSCKSSIIQDDNELAMTLIPAKSSVEKPVKARKVHPTDDQRAWTIFENQEKNKNINHPRHNRDFEHREENTSTHLIVPNQVSALKNVSTLHPKPSKNVGDLKHKHTGDGIKCCPCPRPDVRHQFTLTDQSEKKNFEEGPAQKEKEQYIDYPKERAIFENKEKSKSITHPKRNKDYERQEENKPEENESEESESEDDQFEIKFEENRFEENMFEENKSENKIKKPKFQENESEKNSLIDYPTQSSDSLHEDDKPTLSEHHERHTEEEKSLPNHHQLVLNRNINIYLQIEKFHKQKPILLSRKQYDKVKRVLDGKMAHSTVWKGRHTHHCCSCTIGEVRKKHGVNEFHNTMHANVCTLNRVEQASQDTSWLMTKKETVQKVCSISTTQIKATGESPKQSLIQQIYQDAGTATGRNKIKELTNVKQHTKKTEYKAPDQKRYTQNNINYGKKSNYSSGLKCAQSGRKNIQRSNCSSFQKKECDERFETPVHYMDNDKFCNICRMDQDVEGEIIYPIEKQKSTSRRAASTAEIHYGINTEKRVTFSSSYLGGNVLRPASSHLLLKKHSSNSLYTLFKGGWYK